MNQTKSRNEGFLGDDKVREVGHTIVSALYAPILTATEDASPTNTTTHGE